MPDSGPRAGSEGAKHRRGSTVHLAVDTLGHLLALQVTAAHEQDRSHVSALAETVPEVTGDAVEVAGVDQRDTGTKRPQMPRSILCVWRWASGPKRNKAWCCCHAGGWWSGATPG